MCEEMSEEEGFSAVESPDAAAFLLSEVSC